MRHVCILLAVSANSHRFDMCVAESETVLHGDGMRRRNSMVPGHAALCTSFYNCMFTSLFSTFFFFMLQESSITFLSCNDVDMIKIFIGFYKIISYILFPGALQGRGKAGEREKERREYIKNEVKKENILFYSEIIFPE